MSMHAHADSRIGAAVAALASWDFGMLMLEVNAGAIAFGITAVGGAVIGLVYVGLIKWVDYQSYLYKKHLEDHGSEIEQECIKLKKSLEDALAERQSNTLKLAELTRRLDERERTILEVQGANETYLLEMLEAMRKREPETGIIMESTTKLMIPPSDDTIFVAPTPRADR